MKKIFHNRFKPFETHLDYQNTLDTLQNAAKGADDCELFLEHSRKEDFTLQDNILKNANFSNIQGFGLRVVKGEKTGYAHSNEINQKSIKRAAKSATKTLGTDQNKISSPPKGKNAKFYEASDPINEFSVFKKIQLLQEIDSFTHQLDPRVVQTSINLSSSIQEISILRPEGSKFADTRPMTRLNISVTVEQNGRRESGTSGLGGRHKLEVLMNSKSWEPLVKEALRIALVNLTAVGAPAGIMDVVLGPGWPGILLHEAIGHGLESDFNRKKTSAFSELMGKKIAAKGVTILDDGTIPSKRGSVSIDDEGTPGAKTTLIDNGQLIGYMHDRQNARLMGLKSTGNGRRESYAFPPLPRMTNTYMLPGPDDPESILSELKDGLYAVGFGGGQVDITNGKFVFSCNEAYRIKNGKILHPVKGATIIGDGVTALRNIKAVGNDLKLDPGIGNCGKSGQWVPVGVGQPTLMIGGLTIGGVKI